MKTVTLPCEIGDTLYIKTENGVLSAKVRLFWIGQVMAQSKIRKMMIRTDYCDIPAENIGKTVFLTREEAEKEG
jgi:hypothetical protein